MSFMITCNQCGNKQDISVLINNQTSNPKIIIDIANDNYNDPESDFILITCQSCSNTYEY